VRPGAALFTQTIGQDSGVLLLRGLHLGEVLARCLGELLLAVAAAEPDSDLGGLRRVGVLAGHRALALGGLGDLGEVLAWGLLEVLRNPELADQLRRNGFDSVQNVYNWKAIAQQTFDVYKDVIGAATGQSNEKEMPAQDAVAR